MIQDHSKPGNARDRDDSPPGGVVPGVAPQVSSRQAGGDRSQGSWGAELERKIMSALTLAHWDVTQHPEADRVKVDFIVRRNIRRLQMPRPILIQATTWLDQTEKFLNFLETAKQHFGENNAFLYVECNHHEVRGRRRLSFDELPVMTAVGNIASFFGKTHDANIFRLRMTNAGNTFRRVRHPEREFETGPTTRGGSDDRRDELSHGRAAPRTDMPAGRVEGTLKAWKSVPGESYKDYGWIEAPDGERYNAYWKAFSDSEYVATIRELAEDLANGPWAEMELPVSYRVAPPQQGGKHLRAIEIELLD